MSDFSTRREMMVDTQVRPSDVTKFPIIAAMLTVPREDFVPAAQREAAYVGLNIDLGGGRVVLEPRTLAKLLDFLDIAPGDKVLDVGTGLGYGAAVLAEMGASVVALEADAGAARSALAAAGYDAVTVVAGPLADGAASGAPYDTVLIEGGVEQVPAALVAQVRDGGHIGAIFMQGALGTVRIGRKEAGAVTWRFAFNATAPVLPGFAAAREFVL
jgi:protein-L-isoaspartate(D-aspartate) O-methyltransferase